MDVRNVAIIAHVDHGKTTLVDALLRQSFTHLNKEESAMDLIMDSNDLEKERGITIFSKNAAVQWSGTKINIIDTPGHADFGGEVERVLNMADGCLLLVDAKEGPMPQTRFVLKRALAMGLKVIVVVNKIDKPDARIQHVLDKTFELFIELGADDKSIDYSVLYAAAKHGKAGLKPDLGAMTDISPVFDAILQHIPAPQVDPTAPLQMMVNTIGADSYKGRIATGRVHSGTIRANQEVVHINRQGQQQRYRLVSLMTYDGLERIEAAEVQAGDIASISGIAEVTIGETLADGDHPQALPLLAIEEPTVKVTFSVNDSPFAGREGKFCTSRQIKERLDKELEHDMALRVEPGLSSDFVVYGRGELHIGILVERMRREGYELQVSRPRVLEKVVNGRTLVPFERVYIEVPEAYAGTVIQNLGGRHGELKNMHVFEGTSHLEFLVPTAGLLGYRSEFLVQTRGLGIINTIFEGYDEDAKPYRARDQGSLVAHETGTTSSYGMINAQERGVLFIAPAEKVYVGQVVGQHSRSGDLRVNVCKAKELSNMRSKGDGVSEALKSPQRMDLDDALEYIGDDELVEVTPQSVRIRKQILDENEAKRIAKQGK
jgi:GTP-binding protein